MKQKLLAAAISTVVCASISATSQAEVPITLNMGYGLWKHDGERELRDTETPWVSAEWVFSDQWAAEIFYAEDDTITEDGMLDTDVAQWSLGMKYYGGSYIGSPMRVRPFASFGAGEIDLDYGDFDTVETTLHGGLGMRWMLTERLSVSGEARTHFSLDEDRWDTILMVGLNFFMGNVNPPAPAVVPVGDEDGDGVTDDKDKCPGTPKGTRVDADGCPLPVAQVASIKMMVNFPFDSSVVQEQYFSDIGELAAFLKRFEDVYVDVEGHTDSTGPDDYNQGLSQRRAQAVVDLLVNEHGIDARRLEAKGFGESQPVADNATKEGRAQNRRVMATLEVEYED